MARTITGIKEAITKNVKAEIPSLSDSNTAEWSSWAYIVAVAIHTFELILDLFKKEMDTLTDKITPGTVRWYAEMCKRFQNGDNLEFDEDTALLYYPVENEEKKIIKVAAVSESHDDGNNRLFIKVAKEEGEDGNKKIVELEADELYNFTNYIEAIKFAGVQTEIISTKADQIQYDLIVYHDPSISGDTISDSVRSALDDYKTKIGFDGIVYRQQLIDTVMLVPGVITCELRSLYQHSYQSPNDEAWEPVTTHATLDAGYFEYADGSVAGRDCALTVKPIQELINTAR